ncbi:uncharacterized protein LAJ45_02886 [Morchella importuna]|uniref:uncharacterized protein n=1 Tax=Morchella importuna TaxID=1174673 RepID=UPI001E8D0900|nr:uncharacterized protein LAJ45_02886 [Morchella importuna]KAH8153299.1 hypothetical protein LAJ45_02886 [Morchella importuna]
MSAQNQSTPTPCPECTVIPTTTSNTFCTSPACPGCRQTKLWIDWAHENSPDIFQCPQCHNTPTDMAGLVLQHTICATSLGRNLTVDEEMELIFWLQDFSNDLRWMLRVEYTRICEGNMIITEVGEDEGGDDEWATWMLDEHWLAEKIDDEKYEELVEYLREKED